MINFNLLQAPAASGSSGGGMMNIILLVGMVVVFWVFMIMPQRKKSKEQKKFLENLQKGFKIVTIAGVHGVITKINEDNTLQVEIAIGTSVKLERSAISLDWTNTAYKQINTQPANPTA